MFETKLLAPTAIDPGHYEQRQGMAPEALAALSNSIRRLGVLVPLIVTGEGPPYHLVAGHRRYACAVALNLPEIPCIIRAGADLACHETALAENLLREDPSPIETAIAIARAVESGEVAIDEIAAGMHRSPDWVRRQLAMLEWPDDVLQAVHGETLSVSAAANLACVEDPQYRQFLLEHAALDGATARTTAAWLAAWRTSLPASTAIAQPPVAAGPGQAPLLPQAPCLCCGIPHRTDALSHVPLCAPCILTVRRLGQGQLGGAVEQHSVPAVR